MEKTTIDIISEITIKLTIESGVEDVNFIVDDLLVRPASKSELNILFSGPLGGYLSFQI